MKNEYASDKKQVVILYLYVEKNLLTWNNDAYLHFHLNEVYGIIHFKIPSKSGVNRFIMRNYQITLHAFDNWFKETVSAVYSL